MGSLTDAVRGSFAPAPEYLQFKLTDAEVFYLGGYYGISTAGRLTELSDTAGVLPLGVAVQPGDDAVEATGAQSAVSVTGNTAASPEPTVTIAVGGGILKRVPVAGASTIAAVGELVYLSTDNVQADLTLTETTYLPAVGYIARFNSATSFDVVLFSAADMAGGKTRTGRVFLGTVHTSALEGVLAATLKEWIAPAPGKFLAVYATPTGFDAAYVAGSQLINLAIGGVDVTGGVLTLAFGKVDALADLATDVDATAVTAANEFAEGASVTVKLAAAGTGFTAAVPQKIGFEIWAKVAWLASV